MASSLLQDAMPSPPPDASASATRFRPYASSKHVVTKGRYITSNDPRGYVPVYEYPLNGQWLMVDSDNGYVLWTGIWKALGNSKADIVKMVESQPELASQLRRVRGGYLKIQGTWMPYEIALRLARRVAWPIREDLIPLFGPTFPSTCLSPDQPGYGQLVNTGRRKSRRTASASVSTPAPQRNVLQLRADRTTRVAAEPSGSGHTDMLPSPGGAQGDIGYYSTQPGPSGPSNYRSEFTSLPDASNDAYMHQYSHMQHQFSSQMQSQAQAQSHPQREPSLPPSLSMEFHATSQGYVSRQPPHQHQQRYTPYPPTGDVRNMHGTAQGYPQRFMTPPPNPTQQHPGHSFLTTRSLDDAGPYIPEAPSPISPTHPRPANRTQPGPIFLPPLSSLGQTRPTAPPIAPGGSAAYGASLSVGPTSAGTRSIPMYGSASTASGSIYSLPPISSLDSPAEPGGSSDVLRRLKLDDDYPYPLGPELGYRPPPARDAYSETRLNPPTSFELKRKRSFSEPPFNAYGAAGPIAGNPSLPTPMHASGSSRTLEFNVYSGQSNWQENPGLNRQEPDPSGSNHPHSYTFPPDSQRRSTSNFQHPGVSPTGSPYPYRGEDTLVEGGALRAYGAHREGDAEPAARAPSRPW